MSKITETAEKIFIDVISRGENLGSFTEDQLSAIFNEAAKLCFTAAKEFHAVARSEEIEEV